MRLSYRPEFPTPVSAVNLRKGHGTHTIKCRIAR